MKRVLALLLCLALALGVVSGCAAKNKKDGAIKVIATIYPVYDWVKNVVGDNENVDVSLLVNNGVDLHSFQPTAKNITDISSCDVFIYIGGESDEWAEDVLHNAVNKDMVAVNLMDELGDRAKTEELVEGMQEENDDEHDGEHDGEDEYDEHIWLSLKNAEKLCGVIADKLGEKDSEHKADYEKNAKSYSEKLQKLDASYEKTCSEAKLDTLIFADRFPFRYLTEDYHLKYYAAFSGCSAESEASFKTLVFLADKLDKLGGHTLLTIDGSDSKLAESVIDNAKSKDVKTLTLNSMQSSVKDGETYLSIMESNLSVIKEALDLE